MPPLAAGCGAAVVVDGAGVVVVVVVVVVAALYSASFLRTQINIIKLSERAIGTHITVPNLEASDINKRSPFEIFRRIVAVYFGYKMADEGFLIKGGVIGT